MAFRRSEPGLRLQLPCGHAFHGECADKWMVREAVHLASAAFSSDSKLPGGSHVVLAVSRSAVPCAENPSGAFGTVAGTATSSFAMHGSLHIQAARTCRQLVPTGPVAVMVSRCNRRSSSAQDLFAARGAFRIARCAT